MKRLVWLASYPKSGNTWLRVLLANLIAGANEPVDINNINVGPIASSRGGFDAMLGYDSTNLTHEEIDRLRRDWYLSIGRGDGPITYVKVHDAYTLLPGGEPLFPPEVTKAVVYIVRNPLDVCVSYAHHLGHENCGATAAAMCNRQRSICGTTNRFHEQLRQRVLSWGEHVESWRNAAGHAVHLVRYEDMKAAPHDTFKRVAQFLDLPCDDERVRNAVAFSAFEQLRNQEAQRGFRERVHATRPFFRKGESGGWREVLTRAEVTRLIANNQNILQELGYLSGLESYLVPQGSEPQ